MKKRRKGGNEEGWREGRRMQGERKEQRGKVHLEAYEGDFVDGEGTLIPLPHCPIYFLQFLFSRAFITHQQNCIQKLIISGICKTFMNNPNNFIS